MATPIRNPQSAIRNWLRRLLALVLAAGLLEVTAYSILQYALPPRWKDIKDNRLEPGFSGTIDYSDTVEGRGTRLGKLSVNSLGFRGPEPRLGNERSPERLRVYCLGSSTTFGWGASTDSDTYPAQLERLLQSRLPARKVEVINAGVPGNNSASELRILNEDLPRLKPDLVILWSGWPDWSHYLQPEGRKRSRDALDPLRKTASYRCVEVLRDQVTPRAQPPSDEELSRRKGISSFRAEVITKLTNNLSKMIEACRASETQVVVLGLATPLRESPEKLTADARRQAANRLQSFPDAHPRDLCVSISDFDRALEHTCKTFQVPYLGPEKLPSEAAFFFDGVHLNNTGYMDLAEHVVAEILTLVDATPHK